MYLSGNIISARAMLIVFACIMFPLALQAQIGSIRFNRITTADGLSHEYVNTILRDSTGYMWFGTRAGLNRYDGYEMEIFQNEPLDTTSIASNEVHSSLCTSFGELWFGTRNGLSRFNESTRTFQNFHPPGHGDEYVFVHCLVEDAAHNIWIGTSHGLFIKRINDGNLQPVSVLNPALSQLDSVSINDFSFTKDAYFITTNRTGLWIIDAHTLHPETWNSTSEGWKQTHSNTIKFVAVDKVGDLWLAYGDCTVEQRSIATQHLSVYTDLAGYTRGDMKNQMGDLVADLDGNIWASASLTSVSVFDHTTRSFQHLKDKPYIIAFDNTRSARSIYVDKEGTIWLAMHTSGILYFNLGRQPFINYERLDGVPDEQVDKHLLSNWTRAFAEDDQKRLWVGTTDGISILNRETQTFSSLRNKTESEHVLSSNSIRSMLCVDNKYMLIGSGNGMTRYDFSTGKSIIYVANAEDPHAISGNFVLDILPAADGKIYIATSKGFCRYDEDTDSFYTWDDIPELHEAFGASMRCMVIEDNGPIWIAKSNGNLLEFSRSDNTVIEHQRPQTNEQESLNNVLDMIDDGDHLWMGTIAGLLKFDKVTGQFSRMPFGDKAMPLMVGSFLGESRDILWFTATTGLVKYNVATGVAEYFTVQSGLPTNSFHFQRSFITHDGMYCMASLRGVVMFRPENLKQQGIYPEAHVTSLRILNEKMDLARLKDQYLSLGPDENFFTITLNAFDYLHRDNIQYAYMLEGLHNEWVYNGKDRHLSFTNVPGGDYTLKYKTTTSDGIWRDEYQVLRIHVDTIYYKTWWFMALVVLAAIVIVYAVMKYRQLQKQKVEILRQKIASDLHDDIGATLSSIRMYSEVAKTRMSDNEPLLEKISENARGMVDSMSDIVWAIKPGNDKLSDLQNRMENFAIEMCNPANIELQFSFESALAEQKLQMEQRKDIYLIFKEAVNNSVKYSGCSHLAVKILKAGNYLTLEITDDGKGFDAATIKKGNGLDNMRMRVKKMHGKLMIHSSPQGGTSILCEVPFTHIG